MPKLIEHLSSFFPFLREDKRYAEDCSEEQQENS